MPLGTLDRSPPSLFKQETPAHVRLLVCAALAVFLMVADVRFRVTEPLRSVVAAVLYPLQEGVLKPVRAVQTSTAYMRSLQDAQLAQAQAEQRLMAQTLRASQADALLDENGRLRELLGLRERLTSASQAAEVLYTTADLYSHRITLDKGQVQGVLAGSPVMDAHGVLGQVTRVYPFTSEVSLVIDQDMVIPVMNLRTGVRSIAYGDPELLDDGALELRFVQNDADVQQGDLLTTSGIDGIYPSGLPVGEVTQVAKRADSAFMRVTAKPMAHLRGLKHVMVLQPLSRPGETPAEIAAEGARTSDQSASAKAAAGTTAGATTATATGAAAGAATARSTAQTSARTPAQTPARAPTQVSVPVPPPASRATPAVRPAATPAPAPAPATQSSETRRRSTPARASSPAAPTPPRAAAATRAPTSTGRTASSPAAPSGQARPATP